MSWSSEWNALGQVLSYPLDLQSGFDYESVVHIIRAAEAKISAGIQLQPSDIDPGEFKSQLRSALGCKSFGNELSRIVGGINSPDDELDDAQAHTILLEVWSRLYPDERPE